MDRVSSTTIAEDRTRLKGIVAIRIKVDKHA